MVRDAQRTQGMSVIDLMVTLLLLSMAALGMVRVSAHVKTVLDNATAQQAAWRLADEMADWLRLRGDRPLGEMPEDPSALLSAAQTFTACYTDACAPADAARHFLDDWYRRLRESVPGARLALCREDVLLTTSVVPGWACGGSGRGWQLKLGWRQGRPDRADAPAIVLTVPGAP